MKWYGYSSLRDRMARNNNFHKYRHAHMRMVNFSLPSENAYSWPIVEVVWPPLFSLVILRNGEGWSLCVFSNPLKQVYIPIPCFSDIFVDIFLHKVFISPLPTSSLLVSSLRLIEKFVSPVYRFFVLKLKFRGKGFYLYRNARNVLRFRFGFSHKINRFFPQCAVRLSSKTSLLLFGLWRDDIHDSGVRIWAVRPANVYTGKGIRFNRQILYRKQGKMSTYR